MSVIRAARIVSALKGHWRGREGVCCCPSHDDRNPSLGVTETRDGRVLVHCFVCSQEQVIDALRRMDLWTGPAVGDPNYPCRLTTPYERGIERKDDRSRRDAARAIWDRGVPIGGTLAEAYLRARAIRLPPSDQLRYVPALRHAPSKRDYPAMLARIADDHGLCAVQRTWLDGPAKAAVTPNKMTLGPMGEGAVRLRAPHGDVLGLAEGVETALSASQLYSLPVWAVCGAQRLAKVEIPSTVTTIHIFADPGEVGRREAFAAAEHFERHGRHVEVYMPAAHFAAGAGDDFNACLQGAA